MTEWLSPLNILWALVAAGLAILGFWGGRSTAPEPERDPMQVEMRQRVMRPADVVEATEPETVVKYRVPDSIDTRTDCVTLPSWLDTLSTTAFTDVERDTTLMGMPTPPGSDDQRLDGASTGQGDPRDEKVSLAGLPYVITPVTGRRPTLSVTSRTVTMSAVNPRNGQGLEYRWDVPRPEWRLTANGDLTAGAQYAHTSSTLGLAKRTSVGWLSVEAGYGLAVTDQVRRGVVGRVTLRSTLYSW